MRICHYRKGLGGAHRITNETVSTQALPGAAENLQNETSRHRPLWVPVIKQLPGRGAWQERQTAGGGRNEQLRAGNLK